jgi:NAD(P)-dependent dehydrogenase (short-subunit alcohol dehydrogenase family)
VRQTNILSMFWITKEALKHMPNDGAIINTTSINAFRGHPTLCVLALLRSHLRGSDVNLRA